MTKCYTSPFCMEQVFLPHWESFSDACVNFFSSSLPFLFSVFSVLFCWLFEVLVLSLQWAPCVPENDQQMLNLSSNHNHRTAHQQFILLLTAVCNRTSDSFARMVAYFDASYLLNHSILKNIKRKKFPHSMWNMTWILCMEVLMNSIFGKLLDELLDLLISPFVVFKKRKNW